MIRLGGITGCGSDAAVFLRDEILGAEFFRFSVTPLGARACADTRRTPRRAGPPAPWS
jgi:hypothetical protein